jgi:hypothetical protein
MIQQLLWTEVLLKGGVGLILALIPGSAATMLGMPTAGSGFWPRIVGALLVGMAGALLLQGSFPNIRTIAPAGLIAINLAGAAMLVALLVLKRASQTRRGTVLLWVIAGGLALLSLVEISFI